MQSPIEKMFLDAWKIVEDDKVMAIPLIPQYQIGKYRLDFAHELSKIAIELDGYATHSSPEAIAHDRKRQRKIEAAGWRFIRYGGKEITSNAYQCALEVYEVLFQLIKDSNQPCNRGCGNTSIKGYFACEACIERSSMDMKILARAMGYTEEEIEEIRKS
jgi:very-short-patch-repair endonuclease